MVERFFFDLERGGAVVTDEEGVLAADLDEALAVARETIADLRDELDALGTGEPCWLVIRNGRGAPVGRLAAGG